MVDGGRHVLVVGLGLLLELCVGEEKNKQIMMNSFRSTEKRDNRHDGRIAADLSKVRRFQGIDFHPIESEDVFIYPGFLR